MALGLDAQVGPDLLKGDVELPTQGKPLEDLGRVRRRGGAEQGLGFEGALGVLWEALLPGDATVSQLAGHFIIAG